jgi:hypothetical protein
MYNINYSIKLPTPWKEVLLSRSVWMNILAQWGNIWGLFTLMTQAPTYFKYIHGWDIKMVSNTIPNCFPIADYKSVLVTHETTLNLLVQPFFLVFQTGFLSGMPHLARVSFAILMSFLGDYLLRKDFMSRTNVRKMAAAACM